MIKRINISNAPDRVTGLLGLHKMSALYQTFKEKIIPILHKIFEKIEAKDIIPIYYIRPALIVIHEPDIQNQQQITD